MDLDLTGLDNLAAIAPSGKPLDLPLADVVEDPNQPRQYFDEESIKDLAAQIKAKKVKTPISVKPQNAAGKYVINHGARRYRASILAGHATIPAFIDATHDDYDQVAENIQRENLTPMEIALFIHKRVKAGDKKGAIGGWLGQKASFVSEHLSLIDAPACIQELARTGRVGAKTLYVLIGVHKEFPAEVEAYIGTTDEINRAGALALLERMKAAAGSVWPAACEGPGSPSAPGLAGEASRLDDNSALSRPSGADATTSRQAEPVAAPQAAGAQSMASARSRKLVVLLKVGDRLAHLKAVGRVQVAYKDTGEAAEIALEAAEVLGTEQTTGD